MRRAHRPTQSWRGRVCLARARRVDDGQHGVSVGREVVRRVHDRVVDERRRRFCRQLRGIILSRAAPVQQRTRRGGEAHAGAAALAAERPRRRRRRRADRRHRPAIALLVARVAVNPVDAAAPLLAQRAARRLVGDRRRIAGARATRHVGRRLVAQSELFVPSGSEYVIVAPLASRSSAPAGETSTLRKAGDLDTRARRRVAIFCARRRASGATIGVSTEPRPRGSTRTRNAVAPRVESATAPVVGQANDDSARRGRVRRGEEQSAERHRARRVVGSPSTRELRLVPEGFSSRRLAARKRRLLQRTPIAHTPLAAKMIGISSPERRATR